MIDPWETITAVATAGGGGAARGVVRLSGPLAFCAVGKQFSPMPAVGQANPRAARQGTLYLDPLGCPIPVTVYVFGSPRSYTGEDLVEIHTIGSPPILEAIVALMIQRGARLALPGEFTMRAFLNGKLDLTAAEAVAGLIAAKTPYQAEVALQQLAGGVAQPIQRARNLCLDLLAELEAGLDFADEDIQFIDQAELENALAQVESLLNSVRQQILSRALSGDWPRVVLVGPTNAGKSSLFNALVGKDQALVDPQPGTTRDFLVEPVAWQGLGIELVDTAGSGPLHTPMDIKAQQRGGQQSRAADLILLCTPADRLDEDGPDEIASAPVLHVITKADLLDRDSMRDRFGDRTFPVSAWNGVGLDNLRDGIVQTLIGDDPRETVVPITAERCRTAIEQACDATARARDAVHARASEELVALEIRLLLDQLGWIVGEVYTDDILDRIFSKFCIGK